MSQDKIHVLLAEDEVSLGTIVRESLESRNFQVTYCHNGEEAIAAYGRRNYNILVLDIMMPKVDGFSVAKAVRKTNIFIPIIFLTAKSRTEDVVEGFAHGANDYLKKPFSMEELIVRMNALIMKPKQPTDEWLKIGAHYKFHFEKQLLRYEQEEQLLTNREAQLLMKLLERKNQLTDRALILNDLWGCEDFFNARSMDVFISKLRKKLAKDPNVQILNIRGYGYKLVV